MSSPPPAPPPPSPPPLSGAGSLDTSEVIGNAPASAAPTAPKALQCALGSYVDAVTVHLSHTVVTGYTLQYVGALQRRNFLLLVHEAAADVSNSSLAAIAFGDVRLQTFCWRFRCMSMSLPLCYCMARVQV